MEKVWVATIFGQKYKGVIVKKQKYASLVQLVGMNYGRSFGSYPNGQELIVPTERLSERR